MSKVRETKYRIPRTMLIPVSEGVKQYERSVGIWDEKKKKTVKNCKDAKRNVDGWVEETDILVVVTTIYYY